MSEKGVVIEGDKERIVQVISKIFDNAAKFVKEGTVTISMDTNIINNNKGNSCGESKEIIVNIKDSGDGIDKVITKTVLNLYIQRRIWRHRIGIVCLQKHCRISWWTHLGKE